MHQQRARHHMVRSLTDTYGYEHLHQEQAITMPWRNVEANKLNNAAKVQMVCCHYGCKQLSSTLQRAAHLSVKQVPSTKNYPPSYVGASMK